MNKLKMESVNITDMNIEKIVELFPQVVTEVADPSGAVGEDGKPLLKKAIDFEKLKLVLSAGTGDYVVADDERERYEFTWVGKRQAMIDAATPIRKTLRPCPEESKNWETTENLYIEGDNLEVLKLLQESYLGKVKMIYIDPPYNTGKDFIYKDNFTQSREEYEEELDMFDEEGNRLFQNTETNGRFHSDWCSMIYPRLQLARNLLTDDGVIFISIDDNEVENFKKIGNEVFGDDNFVAMFIWKSRQNKDNRNTTGVSIDHEYIICYSKNNAYRAIKGSERKTEQYTNPDNDPRGDWASGNMVGLLAEDLRPNCHYDLINPKTEINYGKPKMGWRYDKNTMSRLIAENRIIWPSDPNGRPRRKVFLSELGDNLAGFSSIVGENVFTRTGTSEIDSIFGYKYFDYPKPKDLIKDFIKQTTSKKESNIILDFFSGSATTAHAVMQFNAEDGGNRKFIMVQLPEVCDEKSEAAKAGYKTICEIGKERIRRAEAKIFEEQKAKGNDLFSEDKKTLDTGFRVFKLDTTNMKDVYYAAGQLSQKDLWDTVSNIKDDRSDIDLLYGCLLDWGVQLSMPHTTETIDGFTIHTVDSPLTNEIDLVACFDNEVSEDVVRTIAARRPLRAVFRDSSFADSANKINVFEIFKSISPDTTVKVI